METYYVSHGNSFNGDGLSSGESASDGASGAFNNFVSCLEGAPRAGVNLAAGDIVYVRTQKSAVNIDIVLTANLVSTTVGTSADKVTFYIDNGTVWPGDNGVLTLKGNSVLSATNYTFILTGYCHLIALEKGNIRYESFYNATTVGTDLTFAADSYSYGFTYLTPDHTGNTSRRISVSSGVIVLGLTVLLRSWASANSLIYYSGNSTIAHYADLTIDASGILNGQSFSGTIFYSSGYHNFVRIDGITIINGGYGLTLGRITGTINYRITKAIVDDLEALMLTGYDTSAYQLDSLQMNIQGIGTKPLDTVRYNTKVSTHFREGGGYPTLNAMLPNAVYWSYKIVPHAGVSPSTPADFVSITKFMNGVAAVKAVSLEVLMPQSYGTVSGTPPDDAQFFIEVNYVDSNNVTRIETSAGKPVGAALSVGSLVWSGADEFGTVTYNSVDYVPWKLGLTTAYSVKQNSPLFITAYMAKSRGSIADLFFVCPDVQVL